MNNETAKALVTKRYNSFAETGGVMHFRSPDNSGPGIGVSGQSLYTPEEISIIPKFAFHYSMGCTTPTRLVDINPGDKVLDIGCGIGIDVLLAAEKVGASGMVYGVDISSVLIEKAMKAVNESAKYKNIKYYISDMEKLPLDDEQVNIVISNGSINLAFDKQAVFNEAYRVLQPGGKMAVADILSTEEIDVDIMERFRKQWQGCMGGAISQKMYLEIIVKAGFENVEIKARRVLSDQELEIMIRCPSVELTPPPDETDYNAIRGKVASIKITACKGL